MRRVIIAILVLITVLLVVLFNTSKGGEFLFRRTIDRAVVADQFKIGESRGSLRDGLILDNVELHGLADLPESSYLKIQRVIMNWSKLSLDGLELTLQNARLKLPQSEPVVLTGSFKSGQLDLNIYSVGLTVGEIKPYLPDIKKLAPLKAYVKNLDLFITGDYREPGVTGQFTIVNALYKGFLLTDAPVMLDMQFKDIKNDVKLYGQTNIESGRLQAKRADVDLERGKLEFTGLWNRPWVDIHGETKVANTFITIKLSGTLQDPNLILSSEPPRSKEKLMIMLATGKAWDSVEGAFTDGLDSGALTKDFIDYFFFAGRSNSFADKFGISDVSLTYSETARGISARKLITDNLEVGYGVKQVIEEDMVSETSHTVEGRVQVNKNLSVGIEREMTRKTIDEELNEDVDEVDNKIMLKYKKSF